jgi:hypothetical protein
MSHIAPVTLVQKLAQRHAGKAPGPTPCSKRVPVSAYTDRERFEQEREALFLSRPLIIAHETQIPNPGDAIVYDWLGLPLITVRDKAGDIGTFMNVCRHRGMRLVQEAPTTSGPTAWTVPCAIFPGTRVLSTSTPRTWAWFPCRRRCATG